MKKYKRFAIRISEDRINNVILFLLSVLLVLGVGIVCFVLPAYYGVGL